MFNKKLLVLAILTIFCIGLTIASVSANDVDNSTLETIYSNDEMNDIPEELSNDENQDTLQSTGDEPSYSSIEETKIASSPKDLKSSVTWSGKDTETYYLSLLSTNYKDPSSKEQLVVQRIHNTEENYHIDICYYIFNSNGDMVYTFFYPDTRNYQIVYFEPNANTFDKLPDGTYRCGISQGALLNIDDYNSLGGTHVIKWEVVKKSDVSNSQIKTPIKTTLTLKTIKVKKSTKKLVLQATLKKGKNPLKYKKIIFKFNGKTYKSKTNAKGIAKYTIKKNILKKLKVGKKIKYQASYGKITVKKSVKVKK